MDTKTSSCAKFTPEQEEFIRAKTLAPELWHKLNITPHHSRMNVLENALLEFAKRSRREFLKNA